VLGCRKKILEVQKNLLAKYYNKQNLTEQNMKDEPTIKISFFIATQDRNKKMERNFYDIKIHISGEF
jgi:hypothetical protein